MNRSRITGDLAAHGILFADITNDRVGIGSTIPGNKLSLPDSAKIGLGNAEDLTLYHNGSHSWIKNNTGYLHINASTVELKNAADNETTLKAIQNGAVELYHNNSKKFETSSTGATLNGVLTTTQLNVTNGLAANLSTAGYDIKFGDSTSGIAFRNRARFGDGEDMTIFHSGTHSYVQHSGTGNLYIDGSTDDLVLQAGDDVRILTQGNENAINCIGDGAVELYHNANKKFETTSSGVTITGNISAAQGHYTDHIYIADKIVHTGDTNTWLRFPLNDTIAFGTAGTERLRIDSSGHVVPGADSTYDLGLTGTRFRNFYADTLYGDGANVTNVNATTLDSIDSGSFVRSDADDSTSGRLTFNRSADEKLILSNSSNPYITLKEGSTTKGYIQWHSDGYLKFKNEEDASSLRIKDTIDFSTDDSTWHTVWHAGNDGSGSGLDADTLDGISSGSFLRSDSGSGNTNTYDGGLYIAGGSGNHTNDAVFSVSKTSNSDWCASFDCTTSSSTDYGLIVRAPSGSAKALSVYDGTNHQITFTGAGGINSKTLGLTGSSSYPLDINASTDAKLVLQGSNDPYIRFREGTTDKAYIQWHSSGKILICNGESGERLDIGSGLSGLQFYGDGNFYNIWHAGNDGAGSGLDADTCDGQHLGTGSGPTFANVYCNGWFRNNDSNEGLYNQANDSHFYSAGNNYWHLNGNSENITHGALILYDRHNSSQGDSSGRKGYLYWDTNGFGLLSQDGSWAFRHNNTTAALFGTNATFEGNTMWHAGNDGSGSGLDADTVDGIQASSFVRGDVNFTLTDSDTWVLWNNLNDWAVRISNSNGTNANVYMSQHQHGMHIRNDSSTTSTYLLDVYAVNGNRFKVRGADALVTSNGNTMWHAGNDGAGSGLDADTLDGVQLDSIVRHNNNTNYILRFGNGTNTGHTRTSYAYGIFQEGGGWGGQYPDLLINYHTGIKIGCGHHTYAGLRFTADYNTTDVLMGINDGITGGGDGQNNVFIANKLLIGGKFNNNSFNSVTSTRLLFGGGNDQDNYFIGTNTENYGGNYTKLDLRWHTGIRMGAQSGYGGIRFFSNEDLDDLKFSIMGGGNHVKCYTDFLPGNSTSDIGNASNRWRNIYTSDLSLSNEAIEGGNDVDGTWGDWTLQEGEEDIYMINNRTGKKYAMMLREVS